jgi:hypothetical protein
MALVKTWIGGFLMRHRGRFGPNDWPADEASDESRAFLQGWITAFATREVTEAEAEEASRLLTSAPPSWRREHIPAVVGKVEELRRAKGGGSSHGNREAARDASRSCVHCGGEGLATAWAEDPGPEKRLPPAVAAFCVCASGRFFRRSHAEKDPAMLRKILDFGDVIDGSLPGWSDWPPGVPRPEAVPEPTPSVPSRSEINAIFRVVHA